MSSVKDLLRGDVVDGSGTANYVSKWSDADTITNSSIQDDGSTVSVGDALSVNGTTTSQGKLIAGFNVGLSGSFEVGSSSYGNLAAFRSVPGDGINSYLLINTSSDGVTLEQNGSQYRSLIIKTGGSEKVRFPSTGGITFNGDTAAANALDDYEEGTFTPTAEGTTTAGTTTYTFRFGNYTKIGRQVNVTLVASWSAMTGTGILRIGGLPFVIANLIDNYPVGTCIPSSLNWGGGTYLQSVGIQGESFMYISYLGNDLAESNQQCVNESASIRITLTYFTT